jgi:hypothetical protein
MYMAYIDTLYVYKFMRRGNLTVPEGKLQSRLHTHPLSLGLGILEHAECQDSAATGNVLCIWSVSEGGNEQAQHCQFQTSNWDKSAKGNWVYRHMLSARIVRPPEMSFLSGV